MQPLTDITFREDIPAGRLLLSPNTSKTEWAALVYYEKCKNSSYSSGDPRSVCDGTRRNIFALLYIRHGGKCHWCDIDVRLDKTRTKTQGTIDHLKTMRMGRKNYYDGGHVLACRKCNGDRNSIECKELNPRKKKPGTIRLSF